MNKLLIPVLVLLSAAVLAAENLTPEQRKARREKKVMERHGGYITRPGTPSGSIVIVNAQKRVKTEDLDVTKEVALNDLRGLVKVVDGSAATPETALEARKNLKADFAVFVVDDPKQPKSLVAVDDQWAMVNIAALGDGNTNDILLKGRAKKQLARIFAILCGGFTSQFEAPANFVRTPTDLDRCPTELPVDVGTRILPYLDFRGVKPERKVYYRNACQEGWAPQPTNEFQKAVWDAVHQLPSNPIKIKYDPKKGE